MSQVHLTSARYIAPALWTAELGQYVFDLRAVLATLGILMLADFWWGVRESRKNGEHFSDSTAIRRTANKFGDYFTYSLIGFFLATSIGVRLDWCSNGQVGVLIGLAIGAFCELDSLIKHVVYVHFDVRFSWKKALAIVSKYGLRFVISLVKKKNEDIGEALEETFEKESGNGNTTA